MTEVAYTSGTAASPLSASKVTVKTEIGNKKGRGAAAASTMSPASPNAIAEAKRESETVHVLGGGKKRRRSGSFGDRVEASGVDLRSSSFKRSKTKQEHASSPGLSVLVPGKGEDATSSSSLSRRRSGGGPSSPKQVNNRSPRGLSATPRKKCSRSSPKEKNAAAEGGGGDGDQLAGKGEKFSLGEVKAMLSYISALAVNPERKTTSADAAARKKIIQVREAIYVGPSSTRKESARSESKKAAEDKNRPCTPSRFPEQLGRRSSDRSAAPPANDFEALLDVVSRRYFPQNNNVGQEAKSGSNPEFMSPGFAGLQGSVRKSSLGVLLLPINRANVVDRWSVHEIATFEAAICIYGKEFHKISRVLDTKSTKEIVEFYYSWKKTSHYKAWKRMYSRSRVPLP